MKDFRDDLVAEARRRRPRRSRRRSASPSTSCSSCPRGPSPSRPSASDDPKLPVAVVIMADAGKNQEKMAEVLTKATKQAEDAGAKVAHGDVQGPDAPHHPARPPKTRPRRRKEKDDKTEAPTASLVWTQSEKRLLLHRQRAIDVIKDLVAHATAATTRWPATESFTKTQAKMSRARPRSSGSSTSPRSSSWSIKASRQGQRRAGPADRGHAPDAGRQRPEVGRRQLHASDAGNYDSLSKTFFLAPSPCRACSRSSRCRRSPSGPRPGSPPPSPATRRLSWDLDNAYNAINDLVNKFQPGMLNVSSSSSSAPTAASRSASRRTSSARSATGSP